MHPGIYTETKRIHELFSEIRERLLTLSKQRVIEPSLPDEHRFADYVKWTRELEDALKFSRS